MRNTLARLPGLRAAQITDERIVPATSGEVLLLGDAGRQVFVARRGRKAYFPPVINYNSPSPALDP